MTLAVLPSVVARPRAVGLAAQRRCAILESGAGFGELGRFSIYAAAPRAWFTMTAGQWSLEGDWPRARPSSRSKPFEALRFLLRQTARPSDDPLPFQGGWIGFIGYDVGALLERVPRRHARAGSMPDIYLGYHDTFAVHDAENDRFEFRMARGEETCAASRARLEALRRFLEAAPGADDGGPLVTGPLWNEFLPEDYRRAARRILDYIGAGDIFQVNLAQRFSAPWDGDLAALYERCGRLSPAPFAAMLRHDSWGVVSTSPERFLLLEPDGRVETRPIKGTRPRGGDPLMDLLLKEELTGSAKDLAELTMIVDLERNDIGRVCDFGSVRVREHARVESFENVHHLVSIVEGRLHERFDFVDLLKAAFPGGSITGAPKIRSMQIIDELERCRRGVYTGAIGYISDHGRADWNIAIRTIAVSDGTASFHVGGGIVADSDPLAEYRETLVKGRLLRAALLGESG